MSGILNINWTKNSKQKQHGLDSPQFSRFWKQVFWTAYEINMMYNSCLMCNLCLTNFTKMIKINKSNMFDYFHIQMRFAKENFLLPSQARFAKMLKMPSFIWDHIWTSLGENRAIAAREVWWADPPPHNKAWEIWFLTKLSLKSVITYRRFCIVSLLTSAKGFKFKIGQESVI